ncbi:SPOR domain-containing protein [Xinfangfangia sp. CPCC 101601]|uniref:SPOR domain-containing protein n=1 Tax=Pseudogemmobacter lacusdianii TaxID=3069608 RepID=A0ABU0W1I1_9RHOB|nr:SPOR domain-containing protein [Xinfangfangia sp. CPCC 101601]MDQ2067863.1 SPOR domain-containing protein [Xinfangfangia sp. CPCC 101601]
MASAAALALAGCVGGGSGDKTSPAPAKTQKSTRLVERDVEAPDVFQMTDDALWDGRPSLGGVWVASSNAKDPERVIMRNPANGKFVIGALFRRERENPGPRLQISSDAAAALGMLAGAPAKISVTALRREEAPPETPKTPILDSAETVAGAAAPTAGAITAGGVETKPLAAPAPAASGQKAAATAAVAGAAIDAAAPKAAPAAATGRAIQIGIFSVEANAKRAVDALSKAGVPASIRNESANGKSYWSVVARGNAETLKKVKSAGFADAYMLK